MPIKARTPRAGHLGGRSEREDLEMVFQTRLTPELIERHTRAGHWRDETFYRILARRARAHPDREALADHRHRVTYRELVERVDRAAAVLQQLGIGPGDV